MTAMPMYGAFNGNLNVSSTNNYAMSVLKLATTNGITLVDYFAPSNAVSLSGSDQDLEPNFFLPRFQFADSRHGRR